MEGSLRSTSNERRKKPSNESNSYEVGLPAVAPLAERKM
jgi:hypothetical protein